MIRYAKYLLGGLLFIGLLACKKEPLSFEFTGNLSSNFDGTNLANTKIIFSTTKLGASIKKQVKVIETNSKGQYTVKLDRERFEKIYLETASDNYFNKSYYFLFDNLKTESPNVHNFSLHAKAWSKIIIHSQSTDTLIFTKLNGKLDCEKCVPNKTFRFVGKDTTMIIPNEGGKTLLFSYKITGTNPHPLKYDSLYNPPLDTVYYTLTY